MKNLKVVTLLLSLFFVFSVNGQKTDDEKIPYAPRQNRRPDYWHADKYRYTLKELKNNFSEYILHISACQNAKVEDVNNKGKWNSTLKSIERHPTPDWFEDAKFGMFIDWGLWSVAGWAPKREDGKAMYPDWYEQRLDTDSTFVKYHEKNWGKDFKRDDFIPLFTARNYKPEKLAKIARKAGMRYIVPFCKHHGGFCLWPSSFTQRDAGDMGPERDLIRPLVESCKKEGLKFGFYFSLEEWEYPLIDDENNMIIRKWGGKTEPYSKELEKKTSGKIAVNNFARDYLVPQATEFIDRYDPDILWYDGDWSTPVKELQSYEIAAYFYNNAEGRKEVAVNDRLGLSFDDPFYESLSGPAKDKEKKWHRFVSGDFFTSEYHSHQDENKLRHSWEECRGISQSFGYNWQDTEENVISSEEFIEMFVDIVAHGGNLLLIVNLDEHGALPKIQEKRLRDIGKWLEVNGDGIYGTRPYSAISEGDIWYTCSKDRQKVYAITMKWPGKELRLRSVTPRQGSEIYLLGNKADLKWYYNESEGVTVIQIPENLQKEAARPCKYAFTFKITI